MRRIISILLQVILWPVRILVRGLSWGARLLFGPFMQRIDSSSTLSNGINQLSSSMATQRGLLLMTGTGLLLLSFAAHGLVLVLMVSASSFDRALYLLCIPFSLLHVGVLIGFTGIMLATPLGQGYKDDQ